MNSRFILVVEISFCCRFISFGSPFALYSPGKGLRLFPCPGAPPLALWVSVEPCTQPSAGGAWMNSLTFLRTGERARWSRVHQPSPIYSNHATLLHMPGYFNAPHLLLQVHHGLPNNLELRATKICTNSGECCLGCVRFWALYVFLYAHTNLACLTLSSYLRYVLLKEKNMLVTLEQEARRQRLQMPSPERLRKVWCLWCFIRYMCHDSITSQWTL